MYYNLPIYKNLPRFESQMTVDACRCCVKCSRMSSYYTKPSPDPYALTPIVVRTTRGGLFLQTFVFKKNTKLYKLITQWGFLVPVSRFYVLMHNS